MATPYTDIYTLFLQKIKSYDLANLSSEDLQSLLGGYLHSAIPRFQFRCINDLTDRDDELSQFNVTLGDDEKEILSFYMLIEYLLEKIDTDELLRQGFTNREWNQTSQANHLSGLLDLRTTFKKEVDHLVIEYSYNHTDLSGLT